MDSINNSLEATTTLMEYRRSLFIKTLDESLKEREDKIAEELPLENASAQSKMGKVYRLMDEISHGIWPYVACKKGCSDCCRMNVQITQIEARKIEAATSRKATILSKSVKHAITAYAGVACPFLVDSQCSIYDSRPLVCRMHFSFDSTPKYCAPDVCIDIKLPMIEFSGIKNAYLSITKFKSTGISADIRDFFPTT